MSVVARNTENVGIKRVNYTPIIAHTQGRPIAAHTFFTWLMNYKSVWRSKMRTVSMLYGFMEVMITQRIANMTYLALLRTIVVDCTAVRSRAGNMYKFSVRFTVGTNLITSEAPINIELGRFMKNLFKLRCKGFSYGRITEA
jgi:hypothetical protein